MKSDSLINYTYPRLSDNPDFVDTLIVSVSERKGMFVKPRSHLTGQGVEGQQDRSGVRSSGEVMFRADNRVAIEANGQLFSGLPVPGNDSASDAVFC